MREADGGDYPGLRPLLSGAVEPGTNRWLFGHGTPFRAVAGPPHLSEGEAVVLLPAAPAWFVVGRIGVADWARLTGRP